MYVYLYIYALINIYMCCRTFHTPVLTPWELELGLGVRPWNSVFKTHSGMYHHIHI